MLLVSGWGNRAGQGAHRREGSKQRHRGVIYRQVTVAGDSQVLVREVAEKTPEAQRSQHPPISPECSSAGALPEGPEGGQGGGHRGKGPRPCLSWAGPRPEETTLALKCGHPGAGQGRPFGGPHSWVQPVSLMPGPAAGPRAETLWVFRPVQEPGTELASQGRDASHAGGSPSLLVALVTRLFSRRFRRRALRLLISST